MFRLNTIVTEMSIMPYTGLYESRYDMIIDIYI